MRMMPLDFSPLKKALESLQRAIVRAEAHPDDEEVRDAVIQRFEYSYELCWKMLKRHLECVAASSSAIDAMSFRELIREGAEKGLIDAPANWMEYREQRNITSHTYNQKKAESVYRTAVKFFPDAKNLFTALSAKNA